VPGAFDQLICTVADMHRMQQHFQGPSTQPACDTAAKMCRSCLLLWSGCEILHTRHGAEVVPGSLHGRRDCQACYPAVRRPSCFTVFSWEGCMCRCTCVPACKLTRADCCVQPLGLQHSGRNYYFSWQRLWVMARRRLGVRGSIILLCMLRGRKRCCTCRTLQAGAACFCTLL